MRTDYREAVSGFWDTRFACPVVTGGVDVPGEQREEMVMKYMIMLYGSQQDYDVLAGRPTDKPPMTPDEIAAMHEYMGTYHQKLVESGEFVDGQGLTAPVHARRVQLENRVPVVTDGPYPETQEVLAGYTIVECDSYDRATEIAAGLINPEAPGEYVDIRPIADGIEELT
jgi:hypothetical protein